MARNLDPEMMEHIRERMERIRDYVPAEEFDETTALGIAKREIEPLYSGEPAPQTSTAVNLHSHPNGN